MMPVVGLVFYNMCGVGRRRKRLFGFAAVEIPVASASGAFKRGRVSLGGGRGRHELAAAIESMTSQARRMVFLAFFVGDDHRSVGQMVVVVVMRVMALQYSVAESQRLRGLDPGRRFTVSFWGFCTSCVVGGGGDGGGYVHGSNI